MLNSTCESSRDLFCPPLARSTAYKFAETAPPNLQVTCSPPSEEPLMMPRLGSAPCWLPLILLMAIDAPKLSGSRRQGAHRAKPRSGSRRQAGTLESQSGACRQSGLLDRRQRRPADACRRAERDRFNDGIEYRPRHGDSRGAALHVSEGRRHKRQFLRWFQEVDRPRGWPLDGRVVPTGPPAIRKSSSGVWRRCRGKRPV